MVDKAVWVATGGFAKGYRTYVLAALGVIGAAASWAVGDQSAQDAVNAIVQALMSASIGTTRAAMPN